MSDDRRHLLGRRGEEIAAEHLRRGGWSILARNVRTREGELDLIARKDETLAFVVVKTCSLRHGQTAIGEDQLPLVRLGARQRARVRRLALAWLRRRGDAMTGVETIRFDAVGVVIDVRGALRRLEHIENAW